MNIFDWVNFLLTHSNSYYLGSVCVLSPKAEMVCPTLPQCPLNCTMASGKENEFLERGRRMLLLAWLVRGNLVVLDSKAWMNT
jgi:hypothetical protein